MTPPEYLTPHAQDRFFERWGELLGHKYKPLATRYLMDFLNQAEFVEYERGSTQEFWKLRVLVAGIVTGFFYHDITLVVQRGEVKTVLPPGSERPKSRPSYTPKDR